MRNAIVLMAAVTVATLTSPCMAQQQGASHTPQSVHKNKTNFIYSDHDTEHPDSANNSKLSVEGGLFIDQKFQKIDNFAGAKRPVSSYDILPQN